MTRWPNGVNFWRPELGPLSETRRCVFALTTPELGQINEMMTSFTKALMIYDRLVAGGHMDVTWSDDLRSLMSMIDAFEAGR